MQPDLTKYSKIFHIYSNGRIGLTVVCSAVFLICLVACSWQSQAANSPQTSVLSSATKIVPASLPALPGTVTPFVVTSPKVMPKATTTSSSTRITELPMVVLDPVTDTIKGWSTYRSESGGYILPIPQNWPVIDTSQGRGWIEFQDPNSQAGGDNPTVRGGLSMPGRYADTAGGDDLSNGLPDNHKDILFEQAITTPAGVGKLFTLKRDTPPKQNGIWFEQYAVIPAGEKWYVIWLKIPASSADSHPVPELAHMLEDFQLITTNEKQTPHI